MKTKLLFLLLFLLQAIKLFGQQVEDSIESKLLHCIINSYASKNININEELLELENYLIRNKIIKDNSGSSYYSIYKTIERDNDICFLLPNKKIKRILQLKPTEIYDPSCSFNAISHNPDSNKIYQSKIYQLYIEFDKIQESNNVTPSIVGKAIISVLNPSDFDKPLYRTLSLLIIAYTALTPDDFDKKILP